jgi:UDP-N-acetylglucosamine--N-acetylmuramyl-(pentapeptide) pyrophosphoryl-undecaprenol N-acetylglucosamine transferase
MILERVIISGGGTGGHIFPAIAIADEIKASYPDCSILFIGAKGKMEMEKVPKAGYEIVGLDIRGFQRKLTLSNFILPFRIIASYWKARKVIKKFNPQAVIGVGGYASGPTLLVAQRLKIPTLLQEQNSYPGKTNQFLARKANSICVAYNTLSAHFPKEKLTITGNPVRFSAIPRGQIQAVSRAKFGLKEDTPTILVVGGSLGARTLNESILQQRDLLGKSNIQILWQTGKFYEEKIAATLKDSPIPNVHPHTFIQDMACAYSAADIIISRAGALSISELCLVGKPAILVPSPNVAEDHQTKNAQALVDHNAVVLIRDSAAVDDLIPHALNLLKDKQARALLSENIFKLSRPKATKDILEQIEKIARG